MAALTKTGHDKTISTTEPWDVQAPYIETGFQEAQDLYNQPGPAYFPSSTVAPFSQDQLTAQGMVRDTAASNPLGEASTNYAMDVLGGSLVDPYSDAVFSNIQSKVMPAINSQAMMRGRLPTAGEGSNAYADTMTRALTEAYSPWASQNWQFGQKQMADMARLYPQLRAMDYYDAGALAKVGEEQQGLADRELADAQTRWDFYQNQPQNKLNEYMATVGGQNWGRSGETITPVQRPTDLGSAISIGTGLLGSVGKIFGGSIF